MMTFREFMNLQDTPSIKAIKPRFSGIGVTKQYAAPDLTKSLSVSVKPPSVTNRRPSDRPVPKSPNQFLARKNSSFRKGF
jgi:hypothetical protein